MEIAEEALIEVRATMHNYQQEEKDTNTVFDTLIEQRNLTRKVITCSIAYRSCHKGVSGGVAWPEEEARPSVR